ncbi:HtrA protease/chaperone protein [Caenispirillum salinarum AK4]|uniref:HtrA protease/chaperone protein n=1 Tax=Caenispirillum salinarum AK4 TaxID=1238182 RepID=K9HX29_9PROT|nr:PDZ domain-containing protein [Caenispirillum salinarum]EKV32711.1 HtrA protease/chaperone protein [Caenispirillum salinarum AK4]
MTRRLRTAIVVLAALVLAAGGPARAVEDPPPFGFVGAEVQPVALAEAQALGMEAPRGVFVRDLVPWGPAYRAGLRRGDVLLDYAGVSITGLQHLVSLVQGSRPEDAVPIARRRLGQEQSLSLTLIDYPPGWSVRTEATAVLPRLGLTLAALTPRMRERAGIRWGSTGLLVTEVEPESPAAVLGLEAGELVVAADRERLIDPAAAEFALAEADVLLVEGRRGFRLVVLDAGAEPLPPPVMAAGVSWQAVPGLGLVVLDVAHRTPGAAAGLAAGDLVTAIEGADGLPDADTALALAITPARLSVEGLDDAAPRMVALSPQPSLNLAEAVALIEPLGAAVASLTPPMRDSFTLRPSTRGVVVTSAVPGGRAAEAGLRPGLVIVAVNQRFVERPGDVSEELSAAMAQSAAEAVLLIEGAQGFRIVGLPLKDKAPVAPTPNLLQWQGEPAE